MMDDQEEYLEGPPPSGHGKIPLWLMLTYIIMPIWGIVAFFLFWNGNIDSWFDRGYWSELQKAANTTYPFVNYDQPKNENK